MHIPTDKLGRSALHYAANDGNHSEIARLISVGAEINLQDRDGWSPLHFAAKSSSAAAVRVLLEAGATADLRDSHGNTPLFRAVFNSKGAGEVIGLLRAAGSDPFSQNDHGVSPLSLAHSIANYNVVQFFSDLQRGNGDGV